MEDPHFDIDELSTHGASRASRSGFVAVDGQRRPSESASADRDRRDPSMATIFLRVQRIEQRHRLFVLLLLTVAIGVLIAAFGFLSHGGIATSNSLENSDELKLVDSFGRTRVFLRLHSEVPVMQVLDARGRPRLTLGLRFDDTPFIDLSDESGATRASLQVTSGGEPTIRMYNRQGESTFTVN